ncbi:hypothetical protein ACJMK2_006497 [Sinanodonta woodiana]|uniref:Uncharacterized protein n=1 Tax=Sinanodonta woodiana TaxID=1069815 RepID=A0ABD3VWJ6_SINWO
MKPGRMLKFKHLGVILFIFIVVLGIRFIYQIHISDMSKEQMIQRCGISICTPCQYLDPHKTSDSIDSLNSDAFHVAQYKTFPPIQTTQLEVLPTSGKDRIEKILHQKWNTKNIPIQFKDYVKSFIDNHPTWQYMFWTDQSTRQFIQDHFSNLLSLYDNYVNPLNRADSMRYMLLFYYGGVYSDLDIQSLRPLDPMIKKYSCFLAQEPHVHSIVYSNFYEQASTAFMACRKRHPFMKRVLENLYTFFHFANEHDSTGPRFLTFIFRQYARQKGDMQITDEEYVYLSPPEYFNPTVDPGINNQLAMQCSGVACLSLLRKWQCEQWSTEGVKLEPYKFSFTNHVWAHIAYQYTHYLNHIDIFTIFPGVTIYESITDERGIK